MDLTVLENPREPGDRQRVVLDEHCSQYQWSQLVHYIEAFLQRPNWQQIPPEHQERVTELILLISELKQHEFLSQEKCDLLFSLHEEFLTLLGKDISTFLAESA
jgi:hypothetical protein